jgi:hypothetical protein
MRHDYMSQRKERLGKKPKYKTLDWNSNGQNERKYVSGWTFQSRRIETVCLQKSKKCEVFILDPAFLATS